MKKLKICLISLTFSPDSQDGSAKFITGIYKYLKSKGYEVRVLTGLWNLWINNPDIIQLRVIQRSFFWVPQFIFQVLKYLKRNQFDIIHGNGPKGTLPLLLLKKTNFISTIHDLGPIETKNSIIPFEKNLIKQTVKRAKIVTTCSESVKKQIINHFKNIPTSKIVNLYSAIEPKFKPYLQEAQKLREKLNIKGAVILYVGRIADYKGVPHIIKAFQKIKNHIPNLELIIGGEPDFSMKETYESWKSQFQDIHFVGFIPNEEIANYYTMADIFITYSYAGEGFGLTPIEAIACGTPVICSDIKVFREVLQDNAIFVPPKNPELLSKAIVKLLEDDEFRQSLINKAQNYIKRYSWREVGDKMVKVYKKLISKTSH